jgi:hypothetical protein
MLHVSVLILCWRPVLLLGSPVLPPPPLLTAVHITAVPAFLPPWLPAGLPIGHVTARRHLLDVRGCAPEVLQGITPPCRHVLLAPWRLLLLRRRLL